MKKSLLIASLGAFVLVGCGNKETQPEPMNEEVPVVVETEADVSVDVQEQDTVESGETETPQQEVAVDLPSETIETMPTCKEAIAAHLEATAAVEIASDAATVEKGNQIVVDYVGRLNEEEVFDTSVKDVAFACGSYNPHRDYDAGLPFEVGAGQMIAGFDAGVVGMQVGATKTITIPAAQAYGEWSEDNVQEVPLENLPPKDGVYQAGDTLQTSFGQVVSIYKVEGDTVFIDGNHELAGKDLIFDITIKSIK